MNYSAFESFCSNNLISKNRVYLVQKISNACGFFVFDNKLCFIAKSNASKKEAISTNYVEYIPSTEIKAVENDSSFEKGTYDFLVLKESKEEDIINSFIELCEIYGNNQTISLEEFVTSIIDLFQLSRRQTLLDCIGLLGELIVLKSFFEKGADLSPWWHLSGHYSKYDFSTPSINLEVKSSTSDSTTFKIKHFQIFNGDRNYVLLVSLRKTDHSRYSLDTLSNYFKTTKPFSTNIRFLISLEKELKKQIDPNLFSCNFELVDIYCFDVDKLKTLTNIPFNISDISYDYDFDLSEALTVDDLKSVLTL